jgi:hypothetical protein
MVVDDRGSNKASIRLRGGGMNLCSSMIIAKAKEKKENLRSWIIAL